MPNFFTVVTNSDTPRLYVSQQPYGEVLRSLRAWPYSHVRRSFVFEPRLLPSSGSRPEGDPTGHGQLILTARIEPIDPVESYKYQWIGALDELPLEQGLLRAQEAMDYLVKILARIEGKLKTPETAEEK